MEPFNALARRQLLLATGIPPLPYLALCRDLRARTEITSARRFAHMGQIPEERRGRVFRGSVSDWRERESAAATSRRCSEQSDFITAQLRSFVPSGGKQMKKNKGTHTHTHFWREEG